MLAVVCLRTGLMFPPDYVEQWGRKFGIGLGPVPVSEALVNLYEQKPVIGRDGQRSYPMGNSYSPISLMSVTEAEYKAHKPVLMIEDPQMQLRGKILVERQIANKRVERLTR